MVYTALYGISYNVGDYMVGDYMWTTMKYMPPFEVFIIYFFTFSSFDNLQAAK